MALLILIILLASVKYSSTTLFSLMAVLYLVIVDTVYIFAIMAAFGYCMLFYVCALLSCIVHRIWYVFYILYYIHNIIAGVVSYPF